MQRINDHHRIEKILTTSSLNVLFSVINMFIMGGVLAYYNLQIFFIFFAGSILYFGWITLFLKRRKELDYKRFSEVSQEQSKVIADALLRHKIDGVIATNTTLSRSAVQGLAHAEEAGGLSGAPVLEASNQVIRWLKTELGTTIPIIGVGGIMSALDAQSKIDAGAALVQLYTGIIYQGPALVAECCRQLRRTQPSR